jgi:hypothetical protein
MGETEQQQTAKEGCPEKQWKGVYTWGGVATFIVLALLLLDIAISNILGGDISRIPATAAGRLRQLAENGMLGLYNHDFLNLIVQIVLLPAYWALYAALRKANRAWAGLALVFFVIGTTVFVAGNAALPMFDLSGKYAAAVNEADRALISAAGEALLARGAHGSSGAFLAFFLPTFAGLIMSFAMTAEKTFSRATSRLGIAGNALLLVYFVMVTFVAGADKFAVALAMPGGLLTMAWMVLFALRLFRLAGNDQRPGAAGGGVGKNEMPA